MKQEWRDYFLSGKWNSELWGQYQGYYDGIWRAYDFYNIKREIVPFDSEFNNFLIELTGDTEFTYEVYHLHKYRPGDRFDEHNDALLNRKFAYCCELKPSDCNAKLVVDGQRVDEAWFDVNTSHYVEEIKQGHRYSLTVFGLHTPSSITLI